MTYMTWSMTLSVSVSSGGQTVPCGTITWAAWIDTFLGTVVSQGAFVIQITTPSGMPSI